MLDLPGAAETGGEVEMAAALRAAGYLVVKVPSCEHRGGHGRHILITRSQACEGREPKPHGSINSYMGSFGWRVICACGESFADYPTDEDGTTPWGDHVRQHQIEERRR